MKNLRYGILSLLIVLTIFSQFSFAQDVTLVPLNQSNIPQLSAKEVRELENKKIELMRMLLNINDLETLRKMSDLFLVSSYISGAYVDQKSQAQLLELAMVGMVGRLDPYSNLFVGNDAVSVTKSLQGEDNFVGIGLSIADYSKSIVVIDVFEGSPAQRAGLQSGDVITKVNGQNTFGMSLQNIVNMVRGEEGTEVALEIRSQRLQKPRTFSIVRRRITVESVTYLDLKKNLAYIKISSFAPETPERFLEALHKSSNKKGLVIDLRNNPGGRLDSVLKMLGYMMGPAQIAIRTKSRYNNNQPVFTPNGIAKVDFPAKVVILVNNSSASASEVMSGNLKHYKLATLVGVRTFGKATVQNYFGLDTANHSLNDSRLIIGLTTARYYLPDGSNITGEGVQPDVEVELPDNFRRYEYRTRRDTQFLKALEILNRK